MNFDNVIPADIQARLSPEDLQTLLANVTAAAETRARMNSGSTKIFGDHKYTVVVGQKGTTINVMRSPVKGKRVKGTYLNTLYRASHVLEMAALGAHPYFDWLGEFVSQAIEDESLEEI